MALMKMADLFKKASLDYKAMEIGKLYDITNKKLKIKSYNHDTELIEYKKILGLIYKGKLDIYNLVQKDGTILLRCAERHLVYDLKKKDYVFVDEIESGTALSINKNEIDYFVINTHQQEDIVDIEVEGNSNYFSNGILSHNTGGYAIKFAASVRNRITKLDTLMKEGKEVGIKIRVRNYKNKGAGCTPFRDAEMDLYWDSGFDFNSEYADMIKELELINVGGGGNFSSEEFGFKVRGFDNLKLWLSEHPDVFDTLKKRVDEQVVQRNKLDVNNVEPDDDPLSEEELAIQALNMEDELPDYSNLEQED
jgi:hypothetical protein